MERFKKKSIVVEAIRYTGDNRLEVIDFTDRTALDNADGLILVDEILFLTIKNR